MGLCPKACGGISLPKFPSISYYNSSPETPSTAMHAFRVSTVALLWNPYVSCNLPYGRLTPPPQPIWESQEMLTSSSLWTQAVHLCLSPHAAGAKRHEEVSLAFLFPPPTKHQSKDQVQSGALNSWARVSTIGEFVIHKWKICWLAVRKKGLVPSPQF